MCDYTQKGYLSHYDQSSDSVSVIIRGNLPTLSTGKGRQRVH